MFIPSPFLVECVSVFWNMVLAIVKLRLGCAIWILVTVFFFDNPALSLDSDNRVFVLTPTTFYGISADNMTSEKKCCVPFCGVVLHTFPNPSDPKLERFRTWVMKIGGDIIGKDNLFIFRNRRVCHRHFESCYTFPNQRLTALAVPTIHIPAELEQQIKRHSDHTYCDNESPSKRAKLTGPPEEAPPEPEDLYSWQRDADYCSPLEKPHEDQPLEEELIYSWQKDAEDRSLKEEPLKEECIYSWQKHDAVVPCDADIKIDKVEKSRSPSVPRQNTTESTHLHVQCNVCEKEISGFRYVCVQCPDYDLCSTCEARRAHSAHYVLRVPGPRPESELQQVLRTIRQALAASILQLKYEVPVEVKVEVEDPLVEAPGAPFQPAGPPEAPPGHCSTADELQTHRTDAQLRTDDESDTSSDSQDDELDYSCLYEDSDPDEITQSQITAMQILDNRAPITKRIITRQKRRAEKRPHPCSEEPAAKTRVWDSPPSPPALMQPGTEPKQLLRVFDPLGPSPSVPLRFRRSLLSSNSPGPLQPGLSLPGTEPEQLLSVFDPLGPSPSGPLQSRQSLLSPTSPGPLQPGLSPPETETEQLLRVFNPFGFTIQLREAYVPLQPLQLPPSASNTYFIEKL